MQNNSVVTGSDKLQRNRLCLTLGHPFITAARADHDLLSLYRISAKYQAYHASHFFLFKFTSS